MRAPSNTIKQKLTAALLTAIGATPATAAAQAQEPSTCGDSAPLDATVSCIDTLTPQRLPARLCTIVSPSGDRYQCFVEPGRSPPVVETSPVLELVMPNLNVGVGGAFAMDSTQRSDGFSWHILPSLAFKFTANPSFGIKPEIGYAQEKLGDEKARLFVVGVGPYVAPFESQSLRLGYVPRFVIGKAGESAVGLRHGLALQALWGAIGVEGSHQALWVDGKAQHDARIMFTFDPAVALVGLAIVGAVAIWGGAPGGGRPLRSPEGVVVATLVKGVAWA